MKDEHYMPSEKTYEEMQMWRDRAFQAENDRLNWQNRATQGQKQINELGLLVHRLCKMIEDNFIEGKPLDIKKAEEARNYIIKNFQIETILR